MDLALCTDGQSCWNRKGPSPNFSHKVGGMDCPTSLGMLKHSVPSFWKITPHHDTPSTKLYNWENAVRQVPFSWQLPNPSESQMEKHNSSLQRTRLYCSRVQWQCALHHCIRHLLIYGLDATAWPWKPIPWSSLCTVLELIWRPHEVWRSVAIDSAESWRPLRTMHLSIRWPRSVILHGLPLCGCRSQ